MGCKACRHYWQHGWKMVDPGQPSNFKCLGCGQYWAIIQYRSEHLRLAIGDVVRVDDDKAWFTGTFIVRRVLQPYETSYPDNVYFMDAIESEWPHVAFVQEYVDEFVRKKVS